MSFNDPSKVYLPIGKPIFDLEIFPDPETANDSGSFILKANRDTIICGPTTLDRVLQIRDDIISRRTAIKDKFLGMKIDKGYNPYVTNLTKKVFFPELWLMGDDGVVDSSGRISKWTDKSGNGNDAVSVAGYEPRVQAGVSSTNNLSTVDFDDSGDSEYLRIDDSNDLDFSGDFEIQVLVKFDEAEHNDCLIAKDTINSAFSWIKQSTANGGTMKFYTQGNDPSGSTSIATGTWYVLGVSRSSGTMQLWLNGSTDGSSVSNSYDMSGSDDFYIGSRWVDGLYVPTQEMDGEIAEILLWNGSTLTSSERSSIYNYLQNKWFNNLDFNTTDRINYKDFGTPGKRLIF